MWSADCIPFAIEKTNTTLVIVSVKVHLISSVDRFTRLVDYVTAQHGKYPMPA
ncbi:hypothetical protein Hdeb2414_s0005g00160201 [Helianthus debilis subsp. tardiflorus]